MSNSWIRGSRCGVDNCRSKFYRSIDGQRVCQFGHVKEAYMEINDEEDDAGQFVVTRRLTQLTNKNNNMKGGKSKRSSKTVYGSLGRVVYMKALQHILKLQVTKMMEEHGAPAAFEPVTRRIWNQLLRSKRKPAHRSSTPGTDSDYSAFASDSDFDGAGSSSDANVTGGDTRRPPSLLSTRYTLATIYVACRELSLPIYLDDLVRWCINGSLPYLGMHVSLPKGIELKLTSSYHQKLKGSAPPVRGEICSAVIVLMNCLESPVMTLNYEPFLLRSMQQLVLPPQIYNATKRLMKRQDIKLEFKIGTYAREFDGRRFPEVSLLGTMIVATKLYFSQYVVDPSRKVYDWKMWRSIVHSLHSTTDGSDPLRSMDNMLSNLVFSNDSNRELLQWDDKTVEQYCDWVIEKFVDVKRPDPESASVGLRRLFNIFPLNKNATEDPETTEGLLKSSYAKLIETSTGAAWDAIQSVQDQKVQTDEMLREVEAIMVQYASRSCGVDPSEVIVAVNRVGAHCGV